jgi:hypothetical protein
LSPQWVSGFGAGSLAAAAKLQATADSAQAAMASFVIKVSFQGRQLQSSGRRAISWSKARQNRFKAALAKNR